MAGEDAGHERAADRGARVGYERGDLPTDPVDEQARTKVLRFEVKIDTDALVRDYQKKRARQLGKIIDDDLLLREVFQLALDRLVELRRQPIEACPPEALVTAPVGSAMPAPVPPPVIYAGDGGGACAEASGCDHIV